MHAVGYVGTAVASRLSDFQQPLAGLRLVAPGVAIGAHVVELGAQQFRNLPQSVDLRLQCFIPRCATVRGPVRRNGRREHAMQLGCRKRV
jgi:hypothetical protein